MLSMARWQALDNSTARLCQTSFTIALQNKKNGNAHFCIFTIISSDGLAHFNSLQWKKIAKSQEYVEIVNPGDTKGEKNR